MRKDVPNKDEDEEARMKLVDRFRGAVTGMPRRLMVGAVGAALLSGLVGFVGGSATASAFSRPGLPVWIASWNQIASRSTRAALPTSASAASDASRWLVSW